MRTRSRRLLAATLAMAGIAGMAHADTLIMQGIEQARATAAERPLRGMTMKAVATR